MDCRFAHAYEVSGANLDICFMLFLYLKEEVANEQNKTFGTCRSKHGWKQVVSGRHMVMVNACPSTNLR